MQWFNRLQRRLFIFCIVPWSTYFNLLKHSFRVLLSNLFIVGRLFRASKIFGVEGGREGESESDGILWSMSATR